MSVPRLTTRRVTHMRLTWRGITIRVRYTWRYSGRVTRFCDTTDHVEITIAKRDRPLCPLTTTGYRSYMMPTQRLRDLGGPVAFITTALNHHARDPKWIKASLKARQLDLFERPPA